MKKRLIISIVIITFIVIGVSTSGWTHDTYKDGSVESKFKLYGMAIYENKTTIPKFVGNWARNTKDSVEFISFRKDGSFAYYGSEGNGVDDYDMCYSYKYYEEKGILKIECDAGTGIDTPTKIEVISYKEGALILKFDDNKRTFITKKSFDKLSEKTCDDENL